MQRLIIIGNGFDRAHKLPTEYSDFIKQLTEEHGKFYNTICQYIPQNSLWASFEEALAELTTKNYKMINLVISWDMVIKIGVILNITIFNICSEKPYLLRQIYLNISTNGFRSIDTDVPSITLAHIVDKM